MRFQLLLILLSPFARSVIGACDPKKQFCYRNAAVISGLKDDPAATPFCAEYISLSTKTVTEYETVGPSSFYKFELTTVTGDAVTSIETALYAVTTVETVVETEIEWATDTITRTRSTDTITCLNSAYTHVPPVATVETAESPLITAERRSDEGSLDPVGVPAGIPGDWIEAKTSLACSCLSLDAPTTTTTIFQTLEPTTLVSVSTDVVTPIEKHTELVTTTSVSTFKSTVTEKKTTTVTAYVVETTFAPNGLLYRRYNNEFDAKVYDDGFTPSYFKDQDVLSTGHVTSLYFDNWGTGSTLTLPGSGTFEASWSALVFNGFFFAEESGTFTFYCFGQTIDNWGYFWVGDAAYDWDTDSYAIEATRTGYDPTLWKGGFYRVELRKGDAIPITYLWANGGESARNDLVVVTPSGKQVQGSEGFLVQACDLDVFA
ncbi:hypothetical protein FALCPG4_015137 [Fusarium falciforme]